MSQTRRLVWIAMLSAISTVLAMPLLQFSILGIPFLKVDLTILPILIGVFSLGLSSGFVILIIRTILWFLLWNDGVNTYVGLPMNFVAIMVFIIIVWLFIHDKFSIIKYIVGSVIATLAMTITMVVLNMIYAVPVYEKFAHYPSSALSPNAYIIPVVIPFNLLEGVIFAISFAIIYGLLRNNKMIVFYNAKKV